MATDCMRAITLRPYQASDAASLVDLFRASVRSIAARDYTRSQIRAWAPDTLGAEKFGQRCATKTTWIAEVDHRIAGFLRPRARRAHRYALCSFGFPAARCGARFDRAHRKDGPRPRSTSVVYRGEHYGAPGLRGLRFPCRCASDSHRARRVNDELSDGKAASNSIEAVRPAREQRSPSTSESLRCQQKRAGLLE